MKAVIMAGGEGTRLRPLTSNVPKPMLGLVNRPMMEHIINLLRRHGIDEIVVTVAFLSNTIQTYFGDGSEFGVHIQYASEETPLGTAGSVRNAMDHLDERFLVISGDVLTDIDLGQIIAFHDDNKAMATIGLYGIMAFSASSRTREIGVRMALGADRRNVLMLILRQGAWQLGFGLAAGLGLAALLSRALGILLFNVRPWDPAIFAAVIVALAGAGLVACLIPAGRATRAHVAKTSLAFVKLFTPRLDTTTSTDASGRSRVAASCSRKTTFVSPKCSTLRRSRAIASAHGSTAITRASRPQRCASSTVRKPVPAPTSKMTSPGRMGTRSNSIDPKGADQSGSSS